MNRLGALTVAGALLTLGGLWFVKRDAPTSSTEEPIRGTLKESQQSPHQAAPSASDAIAVTAPDQPYVPRQAKPNSAEPNWTSFYASRDPYPEVIRLRSAKERGSFAASFRLTLACLEALTAISRAPSAHAPDQPAPDGYLQAALAAKQEIEVRCIRFMGQDVLDHAHPLPGDTFGDRYRRALNVLSKFPMSPADAEAAIEEMVDQGDGEGWMGELRRLKTWRGESWKDRSEDFDHAAWIALRRATSSPAAAGPDLRNLTNCYRAPPCTEPIGRGLSRLPSQRRQIVETLAREMEASLRAGDPQPWLPTAK